MKFGRKKHFTEDEDRIRAVEDTETEILTYADLEQQRFQISDERRRVLMTGVLMLLIFVLSFFLVGDLLDYEFSLAWVGSYAMRRFNDLFDLITGNHLQSGIDVFLCQFATPLLCGIALASSGACFQAVFHNPMASPTMLGVESGGTLGVTLYVMLFGSSTFSQVLHFDYEGYAQEYHSMSLLQRYGQYFSTFLGCILVVGFIVVINKITGRNKVRTIPLMIGGSVFTTSVNSVVQAVEYYQVITHKNTTLLQQLQEISSGKFEPIARPSMLLFFAIPVLVCFVLLLFFSGRLNIIALGEEEARLMGVNIEKDRLFVLLLSTLMTAAVVAFCGTIGFVGLIVPHLARNIVGSDFRHLIPASAFLGAIFMILAYDIAYMTHFYLDTGIVINLIGGGTFLVTMIRYRRNGNADWA